MCEQRHAHHDVVADDARQFYHPARAENIERGLVRSIRNFPFGNKLLRVIVVGGNYAATLQRIFRVIRRALSSCRDNTGAAQRGDGVWRHAEKVTQHFFSVFAQRRRG